MSTRAWAPKISPKTAARAAVFLGALAAVLFLFARAVARAEFAQKVEIAACYAARRWALEAHRSSAYVHFDRDVLRPHIELRVSEFLVPAQASVEVARSKLWDTVTLRVRVGRSPLFPFRGDRLETSKFVMVRGRPIAFNPSKVGPESGFSSSVP